MGKRRYPKRRPWWSGKREKLDKEDWEGDWYDRPHSRFSLGTRTFCLRLTISRNEWKIIRELGKAYRTPTPEGAIMWTLREHFRLAREGEIDIKVQTIEELLSAPERKVDHPLWDILEPDK